MNKNMKLIYEIMNFCDDKFMEMDEPEDFKDEKERKLAEAIDNTISNFIDDLEDFRIEYLFMQKAKEQIV